MCLKTFGNQAEEIKGVKNVSISEGVVRLSFKYNPSQYYEQLDSLCEEHDVQLCDTNDHNGSIETFIYTE